MPTNMCKSQQVFFFFSLSFISRDFAFQNILKCFITKIAEHRVPVMGNLKPQDKTELAGSLNFVPYRCFIRCCFGLEYDTYMSLGFP